MNKKLLKSVAALFAVVVLGVSCADNKATEPEIKYVDKIITQPGVASLSVKGTTVGSAANKTVNLALEQDAARATAPKQAVDVEVTGLSVAVIEAAGKKTDFIKYTVKSVARSLKDTDEVQDGDTIQGGVSADTSAVNKDAFVIAAATAPELSKFSINIKNEAATAIQGQIGDGKVGIFEVVVEATAEGFNPAELTVFVKITAHAAKEE